MQHSASPLAGLASALPAVSSLAADQFLELLGRLPATLDLDQLARDTGAIRRVREVKSGCALLRIALARGPGGLSLKETAAWSSQLGLGELSGPGMKKLLDRSVSFLNAVMHSQLVGQSPGKPVRWDGRCLRCGDGTSISKPGSKGTDWRVHAVYDLGRGGFSHLEVTDQRGGEAINRGAPVAGEIRICDRNYATAPSLHRFLQDSAGQADFIVRVGWRSFSLSRPDRTAFDLITHLSTLPDDRLPHEAMVQASRGPLAPPLPLRLVILRKTPQATEQARKKLLQEASRKQKTLDPRSLVAAEFIVLATSLPADAYPAEEVLAAYRLRWQIELAFKRLKSLLHIDALPTHTEAASRCWLLAHLILALLCDDLSQEFLESSP